MTTHTDVMFMLEDAKRDYLRAQEAVTFYSYEGNRNFYRIEELKDSMRSLIAYIEELQEDLLQFGGDYFDDYMGELGLIDAPEWDAVTTGSMSSQPYYWDGTTCQRAIWAKHRTSDRDQNSWLTAADKPRYKK